MMLFSLKEFRNNLGLSQIKLASISGVSIPTIQNIEANNSNPTIEVLEKLLNALGLEIDIHPMPFDSTMACILGVPLLAKVAQKTTILPPSSDLLKRESKKWGHLLFYGQLEFREELAIIAFVTALKDHYSDFYKREFKAPIFDEKIEKNRSDGHVLKLRRIALAALSKYL